MWTPKVNGQVFSSFSQDLALGVEHSRCQSGWVVLLVWTDLSLLPFLPKMVPQGPSGKTHNSSKFQLNVTYYAKKFKITWMSINRIIILKNRQRYAFEGHRHSDWAITVAKSQNIPTCFICMNRKQSMWPHGHSNVLGQRRRKVWMFTFTATFPPLF